MKESIKQTLIQAYDAGKRVLSDAGYTNGAIDARILLCHAAGITKEYFYAHSETDFLSEEAAERFDRMLRQRLARVPVAYIVGHKEFMGLDFEVNPSVLIPRPATETLTEAALDFIAEIPRNLRLPEKDSPSPLPLDREQLSCPDVEVTEKLLRQSCGSEGFGNFEQVLFPGSLVKSEETGDSPSPGKLPESGRVYPPELYAADIGTGSGCIAVSLAFHTRGVRVFATDISCDALRTARKNINRLHKEFPDKNLFFRIHLLQGDLLEALPEERRESFHIIVSNPPYVTADEWEDLMDGVKRYEPRTALVPVEGAEAVYRKLAGESLEYLLPGGMLLTEIGASQGEVVCRIFAEAGYQQIRILQDLEGFDRVVLGKKRVIPLVEHEKVHQLKNDRNSDT